jgi:hypothetical protein
MLASSLSWDNEVDLGVDPEQVSEVRATGVARASTWSAAALGAGQDVTAQDHDPRAHALAPPAKTLDQASGSTPVAVERGLQACTAATLAGARKPFRLRDTFTVLVRHLFRGPVRLRGRQ